MTKEDKEIKRKAILQCNWREPININAVNQVPSETSKLPTDAATTVAAIANEIAEDPRQTRHYQQRRQGLKIALIDSGIDYTHPAPDNGCFGKGCLVSFAAQPNPLGFIGAAPGVTLGAYRMFGCDGLAGDDMILAAYNKAFEDGANIITVSIGEA
ncbi:hypothetical protein E4U39_006350 [Claviceps sp. Clav50 group G5]|nr:hypothetical protein E4U39_006350 [Claviceps sp. Clav50 group G5]